MEDSAVSCHGAALRLCPSRAMGMEMPLAVWTPREARAGRRKYPAVYLLHGKSAHAERIDVKALPRIYCRELEIASFARRWGLIVVAPACGNNWYMDCPAAPGMNLSAFIGTELPGFIESEYPAEPSRESRMLAGFSMGGYGAFSLLCRHSDVFGYAMAKAPSDPVMRSPGGEIRDYVKELVGPDKDESRYLEHYSLELLERLKGRSTAVSLSCGIDDSLLPHCHALSDKLRSLGVPLHYSEVPGAHEFGFSDLQSLYCGLLCLIKP